jgi:hypothetical protein
MLFASGSSFRSTIMPRMAGRISVPSMDFRELFAYFSLSTNWICTNRTESALSPIIMIEHRTTQRFWNWRFTV